MKSPNGSARSTWRCSSWVPRRPRSSRPHPDPDERAGCRSRSHTRRTRGPRTPRRGLGHYIQGTVVLRQAFAHTGLDARLHILTPGEWPSLPCAPPLQIRQRTRDAQHHPPAFAPPDQRTSGAAGEVRRVPYGQGDPAQLPVPEPRGRIARRGRPCTPKPTSRMCRTPGGVVKAALLHQSSEAGVIQRPVLPEAHAVVESPTSRLGSAFGTGLPAPPEVSTLPETNASQMSCQQVRCCRR